MALGAVNEARALLLLLFDWHVPRTGYVWGVLTPRAPADSDFGKKLAV